MKIVLDLIGSFLAACFIAIFFAGWWLYDSPRPVSFLNPYFEETLNRSGHGYRVVLGETTLSWGGWKRALIFRLHDVKAMNSDDTVFADIPEMAVGVSFAGLLKGEIAFSEMTLFRPDFTLTADHKGDVSFSKTAWDRAVEQILTSSYLSFDFLFLDSLSFDSLAMHDARILVKDQRHGISWLGERTTLIFSLVDRTLTGNVSSDLVIEEGSSAALRSYLDASGHSLKIGQIRAFLNYDFDTGGIDIDAHIDHVQTLSLARLAPDLDFLNRLDFVVSGEMSATLRRGDDPQVAFSFHSPEGNLDIGLDSDRLSVNDFSVYGRLGDGNNLLIDQFMLTSGDTGLSGSAVVATNDQGISSRGTAIVRDLPAAGLGRYWPPQFNDFAKTWLTENLNVGLLTKVDAAFSFFLPFRGQHAPMVKLFHGSLEFEDVSVVFLDGMPPVSAIHGRGFFSRDQVNLIIDDGRVDGMTVDGGTVSLTRLDTDFEYAHIEAGVHGSLPELMRILDHDPVQAASFLGIEPAATRGEATALGVFSFPMVRDLSIDQVDIAASIDLRDSVLTQVIAGHALEDGVLFLHVDKEKLTVEGSGHVEGVDITISGTEHFIDSAAFKARYFIAGVMEEQAWDRFGFTVDPFISGAVAVDLIWTDINAQKAHLAVAADLGRTTLSLPMLDWVKEAGVPGTAQLTVSLKEDGSRSIDGFSINASDLQATGHGEISPESGALKHLMVSQMRFGRSDLEAEIIFGNDPVIRLYGKSIDLEPFFDRDANDSYEESVMLPDFFTDIQVDTMWVGDHAKISNVAGNLEYRDGLWRSAYVTGLRDSNHKTRLRISPDFDSPGRYIRFLTEDTGDFLRSMGLYSHMAGGDLLLEGRIDDRDGRHSITGEIDLSDFEIVKSPFFARLLSLSSLDGLVERLGGDGLGFRRLVAPFQFADHVLKIDQGHGFGALGLTFGGIFDFKNDTVDMAGSIVPSYALNSIWADIPIIGGLLTGFEEGGGIFALTYRVLGNQENPRVTINPLSALTPGIFREFMTLFEGEKPKTSFSPEEEQPPESRSFP